MSTSHELPASTSAVAPVDAPSLLRSRTGLVRTVVEQALWVVRKDSLLEWRGRSRGLAVLVFGIVTLFLFSFAIGPDSIAAQRSAAGFLVLALLLSSTLGLTESFRHEREQQAIEGLLLLPVEPTAIYYGKAIGNTLFLWLLAPVLAPAAMVLYSVEIEPVGLTTLLALWLLAAAGVSAPGTLYTAMTSRLTGKDVVLPVLLFPLVVPVLLASVKAMALVMAGDPMGQIRSWVLMLAIFDLVYWILCGLLFPFAIEEGV